jgi:hypothetical protein
MIEVIVTDTRKFSVTAMMERLKYGHPIIKMTGAANSSRERGREMFDGPTLIFVDGNEVTDVTKIKTEINANGLNTVTLEFIGEAKFTPGDKGKPGVYEITTDADKHRRAAK